MNHEAFRSGKFDTGFVTTTSAQNCLMRAFPCDDDTAAALILGAVDRVKDEEEPRFCNASSSAPGASADSARRRVTRVSSLARRPRRVSPRRPHIGAIRPVLHPRGACGGPQREWAHQRYVSNKSRRRDRPEVRSQPPRACRPKRFGSMAQIKGTASPNHTMCGRKLVAVRPHISRVSIPSLRSRTTSRRAGWNAPFGFLRANASRASGTLVEVVHVLGDDVHVKRPSIRARASVLRWAGPRRFGVGAGCRIPRPIRGWPRSLPVRPLPRLGALPTRPSAPRNVAMPDSALMPAPLRTTSSALDFVMKQRTGKLHRKASLVHNGRHPAKAPSIFASDEQTSIHCLRFGGHVLAQSEAAKSGNH